MNCAERGLLLLRVRDEITMTMAAYQTLYQSSIAFGMRKALQVGFFRGSFVKNGCRVLERYLLSIFFNLTDSPQAEQGKEDLIANAEELRVQKTELERTVAELRQKSEQAERRAAELREAEEKKHMEEIQFLKKTNQQLKVTLTRNVMIS